MERFNYGSVLSRVQRLKLSFFWFMVECCLSIQKPVCFAVSWKWADRAVSGLKLEFFIFSFKFWTKKNTKYIPNTWETTPKKSLRYHKNSYWTKKLLKFESIDFLKCQFLNVQKSTSRKWVFMFKTSNYCSISE